jgi:hypothetical protein
MTLQSLIVDEYTKVKKPLLTSPVKLAVPIIVFELELTTKLFPAQQPSLSWILISSPLVGLALRAT